MPLINSINVAIGVGTATFTSASTRSYVDRDDGLIKTVSANVARFEAKGYLVESDATNLQDNSEAFTGGDWADINLTFTADNAVAPDGTTTMDLLIPSTGSAAHYTYQGVSITISKTYTQSVYVKSGGYDYIQMSGNAGFDTEWATFDLTDGTIPASSLTNGTATVEDFGNGVYRCSLTLPATSTEASGRVVVSLHNTAVSSYFPSWAGDGTSGVHLWGGQFELGASPSSYIKSTTTPVTRLADNLSIDSDNIPVPTEDYSVSYEVDLILNVDGDEQAIWEPTIEQFRYGRINNLATMMTRHGGTQIDTTFSFSKNTTYKVVQSVDVSDGTTGNSLYINGNLKAAGSVGTVTGTKTAITIGKRGAVEHLNGHIKNFKIFDKALSAGEVATL